MRSSASPHLLVERKVREASTEPSPRAYPRPVWGRTRGSDDGERGTSQTGA